jgi:creatinine amidohydrolase/Fe(II)-dependent formamide hydrolase-like protein
MSYLVNMLPSQIKQAVQEQWPVIIPSGCIELHGNHLPVGTDIIIVEEIIKKVESCTKIVVCPSISIGPTGYGVGGPETGTMDVKVSVFKDYVKEIMSGLYGMGFRRIIVVQQHQGTDGPEGLSYKMAWGEIFNDLKKSHGNGWWTKLGLANPQMVPGLDVLAPAIEGLSWPGGHAGKQETEAMLALKSEIVEMDRLKPGDFWWNWYPGEEADRASVQEAKQWIEKIVQKWIQYIENLK